jgi:hypothetical protein
MNHRFGLTVLIAFSLPVLLVGLALEGPSWISQAPYIHDLTRQNLRAHGVPAWWHTFNFVWALCVVAGAFYLRRRAKARR